MERCCFDSFTVICTSYHWLNNQIRNKIVWNSAFLHWKSVWGEWRRRLQSKSIKKIYVRLIHLEVSVWVCMRVTHKSISIALKPKSIRSLWKMLNNDKCDPNIVALCTICLNPSQFRLDGQSIKSVKDTKDKDKYNENNTKRHEAAESETRKKHTVKIRRKTNKPQTS